MVLVLAFWRWDWCGGNGVDKGESMSFGAFVHSCEFLCL
jgi:hypothetical protein